MTLPASPDNAAASAAGVPAFMPDAAVRSILIGLMLAILLGALDQTIVSVALPRMAQELHGFELLAWVVSSYLVASTVATPIYGKLGDLFGRRLLLSVAIGTFLLASLACALAQTMPELVAARAFQGLGGGGLISIAQAIIADVVPLRERGRYQGYISGVFAVSSVAGPVVGGLLTYYLSWRWCFWINLPLGAAAFLVSRRALTALVVPAVRRPIDYAGAALLSAGLTALLIAITRSGQGVAWNSLENTELFGAAAILLVAFAFREAHAIEPIVPLQLFRIPAVALCCAVLFLGFFNLVGLSVLMPLQFQIVAGATANTAAWRLIPLSLMIPAGAFVAGRLMLASGRYRPIQSAGAAIVPIALLAIAFADVHGIILAALAMAAAGFGIGLQFPTSLVAVQNAVPPHHIGIATATTAFFRSMGGAIGISLLSSVLMGSLQAADATAPNSGELLRGMIQNALSGSDPTQRLVLEQLAMRAFRRIFEVAAGIAVIPIVLTLFVPDKTLRGRSG